MRWENYACSGYHASVMPISIAFPPELPTRVSCPILVSSSVMSIRPRLHNTSHHQGSPSTVTDSFEPLHKHKHIAAASSHPDPNGNVGKATAPSKRLEVPWP